MVGMVRSITVVLIAVMVLGGCSRPNQWVGFWRGSLQTGEAPPGSDPSIGKTLAAIKLTIRPDGSFDLTEAGFGMTGTAQLGTTTGTLTIQTLLGKDIGSLGPDYKNFDRIRKLTMNEDGTITYSSAANEEVTLKRGGDE